MYKYAGIVVNNKSVQVDKVFTYEIPDSLLDDISTGLRVKVPFGKGNTLIDGFIFQLYEVFSGNLHALKQISRICEDTQWFTTKDIELIDFMREKYLCTYIDCIKAIIPTGTTNGMKNKFTEAIFIGNSLNGKYMKEPYISIYNTVFENNGKLNKNQLCKIFNFSLSSINSLLKYNFLQKSNVIIQRYNIKNYKPYDVKILNTEQDIAVNKILNESGKLFLIHGVTGSGKTEVYMSLVSKMLEEDKECIILVPEISLTPQMVERFKGRFGRHISVFHSKLSEGERFDEWMRVKNGEVKIAIGARSAIFLPFCNLGMIIIDEEHETSYKSDSNPKYDAREIAEFKSRQNGCKIIFGSATPSIETYYRSRLNNITLININKRADNSSMPDVNIVDMRQELMENNKSIFSRSLYNNIKECLNKNEQIILFLNRRGFSTFVSCRQCGYVFKCDKCDISMTYHFEGNYLNCHYCGSRANISKTCPKCGSKYVKYFGAGTEKIEGEIKRYFPSVKVLRMDFDTTRKKNSHENIYNSFKDGEAQILIGTQMIAKGLDFPNVTLVGVLAADLSLNLPDYKAAERTFQLLTQVSGRSGRGEKPGKVIIQTYSPEHYSIQLSKNYDYVEFFQKEMLLRKEMNYPPFSKILLLSLSSKNEDLLIKTSKNMGILINDFIISYDSISMLGPCPCSISKIKESYRWQIMLKGEFDFKFAQEIKDFIYKISAPTYTEVKISIDINPNSLL